MSKFQHPKYRHHEGNLVPVYEVPDEYYVNVREPGYPYNFHVGASKSTVNTVVEKINKVLAKYGGRVKSIAQQYSTLYISGVSNDAAVLQICDMEEVSNVGPKVSFLPPESHRYYATGEGEIPETFTEDVLAAAIHLNNRGCL